MKESIFQDKKPDLKKYFSLDSKEQVKTLSGNTSAKILELLESEDALNFMYINKFTKNILCGNKAPANTKELVFAKVHLPLLIKNGIEKIISLERYANILFGEIIEPFVNNFYEQNFLNLNYGNLRREERTSVLKFLYFHEAPKITMDRIKEMLRYIVFVKLIEVIYSDTADELIRSIYDNIDKHQTQIELCKNIVINYLNSDAVVVDIRRFLNGPNHRGANRWVYMFAFNLYNPLEQKFPENAANKDKEKEIVCMLLKFITSRLVHLEKPSEKFCERAVYYLITHFCLAFGGRFLTDSGEFASYLNKTGDLEQLLFNPEIDFINLFDLLPRDSHDYSKEYRKYLKTERAKVYFDKMLILADRRKSKCEKITTLAGYYGLYKWVAVAKDTFNSLYGACLDTCFCTRCKKRRSESNLNLNINLNQNENIPLLDNNNQENNHDHRD